MNVKLLFVIIFLILGSGTISAQCNCDAALSADLLNVSNQYNESQFREFLYQYFKSSKRQRKAMKRSYSNSFGLKAVVDGLPLEFSSSNNSSRDSKEFYAFEQEVIKNNNVSNQIIQSIATKYFSDNQLEAYKACLQTSNCSANGVTSEFGGDIEDVFFVRILFNNSVSDTTVELKTDVQYTGCSPVYGLIMKKGEVLKVGQDLVQYFKRDDINKVATVNIRFTNGLSAPPITLEKKNSNATSPIGTICSSVLNYDSFLEVNNYKKTDNMSKALWVPCDGRNVTASSYGKFSGNVPDLRGVFTRGVNDYGVLFDGVAAVAIEQANPAGTNAGIFQSDSFKSHAHNSQVSSDRVGDPDGSDDTNGGAGAGDSYWRGNKYLNANTHPTSPSGGNETRPKNVSVYYYIRIN